MTDGIHLRIALHVTELRVRRGLSQAALASRAGLPLKQLQEVESAADPLQIDTLSALADALDVTIEQLVSSRAIAVQ